MNASLNRKAGFSLPLVLTIMVILMLSYGTALHSLVNLRDETKQSLDRAEFDRLAMTAEARLSYMMMTEPFGAATMNIGSTRNTANSTGALTQGLIDATNAITLDNRPYQFLENADSTKPYLTQVQDEAGLINLYYADVNQLTRLFETLPNMAETDAENLAAELVAYTTDPTQHQPMRRPSEIFARLEDAADLITPHAWSLLADKLTAYSDNSAFNINTAAADVIAIMFNVDDATAQAIVDGREGTVIASPAQVGLIGPTPGRGYTFTGGRLRFTFTDPKSGLTYRSSLLFTPTDTGRPLWVENPRTLNTTPPDDVDPNDLDPFPDVPSVTP